MFKQTKNHLLLTIICASTLITATAPIKAWDLRHTVATGLGVTAVGGMLLYKKTENDIKRIKHYVTKLASNKKFIEHNEMIKNNETPAHTKLKPHHPYIWESCAQKDGVTIYFYLHIKIPNEQNIDCDYEIVAVSAGIVKYLIFHNVQKNTFTIPDITPQEFIERLEKINSMQPAKQA